MLNQNIHQISPRPFLKWAGGKSKLIEQYTPYFPKDFKTYYEPFLGGGAVFFHLQPKNAVISDINSELINTYCCVRDHLEQLIPLLEKHQQKHSKEYYYYVRSQFEATELASAARLIYLNKTCFNGLYRENSKGLFNVPIGKYKNPKIYNAELLYLVSEALQSAQITVKPFESILKYANFNDFVYFDPPYYPLSSTSNFTAYNCNSFSEYDQIKLRNIFIQLAKKGSTSYVI